MNDNNKSEFVAAALNNAISLEVYHTEFDETILETSCRDQADTKRIIANGKDAVEAILAVIRSADNSSKDLLFHIYNEIESELFD